MPYGPEDNYSAIDEIVLRLASKFGRFPTVNEVVDFILGDDETRDRIWNKEI